jgi:hypothetical protein
VSSFIWSKLVSLRGLLRFPLQILLIQAQIVDQPAAADRLPEELFLSGIRVDPEAVGILHQHGDKLAQGGSKDANEICSQRPRRHGKPSIGKLLFISETRRCGRRAPRPGPEGPGLRRRKRVKYPPL